MNNEENINVLNFHCVANFKRHNYRAAGVGIFKNNRDTTNVVSSEMGVAFGNSESYRFNQSRIGKICIVRCEAENGQVIVMIVIYISPNQSVKKIIEFIHENLLAYTEAGSALLNRNLHKTNDFNVDFSKNKSKPLVDFLKAKLNLIDLINVK